MFSENISSLFSPFPSFFCLFVLLSGRFLPIYILIVLQLFFIIILSFLKVPLFYSLIALLCSILFLLWMLYFPLVLPWYNLESSGVPHPITLHCLEIILFPPFSLLSFLSFPSYCCQYLFYRKYTSNVYWSFASLSRSRVGIGNFVWREELSVWWNSLWVDKWKAAFFIRKCLLLVMNVFSLKLFCFSREKYILSLY